MLKRRFPALKYDLRPKLANTFPVIVAIVVLHNIAVTLGGDDEIMTAGDVEVNLLHGNSHTSQPWYVPVAFNN